MIFKSLGLGLLLTATAMAAPQTYLIHASDSPVFEDDFSEIYPAFYDAAKRASEAAKQFNIPPKRRFIFFGTRNIVGYQEPVGTEAADALYGEFKASDRCETAGAFYKDYVQAYCTHPQYKVFTGADRSFITGPSTIDGIQKAITLILKTAHPGDRVLFSYAGHGNHEGSQWMIGTSQGSLFVPDIQAIAKKVTAAGLLFQANIMSCYSGAFRKMPATPGACISTSTRSDLLFEGTIEPMFELFYDRSYLEELKRSGSPLKAYACGLGNDPVNFPESTLDTVTETWEEAQGLKGSPESFTPLLLHLDSKIESPEVAEERAPFVQAYLNTVLGTMQKCHQLTEVKTDLALNSCLDQPDFIQNAGVTLSPQDGFRSYVRDAWTRQEEGSALNRVNRHLRLITEADPKTFQQFKSAFCCMGASLSSEGAITVCQ